MVRGGKRRGAGRPTGSGVERKALTVRLPADVHQAMVDTQMTGEPVNEYITAAVAAEAQRRREE